MTPDAIAVIPARYNSTRLPGKPLADLCGHPVVWHVFSRAAEALGHENVYVATDSPLIIDAVRSRGGNALLVDTPCSCGTERCAKALALTGRSPQVVVNVQGDEPFIDPADISRLVECFTDPTIKIATLARTFDPAEGFDALFDPASAKVVLDNNSNAIYFSRSIIPYVRGKEWTEWIHSAKFHIHIGTYAFTPASLRKAIGLPVSPLETAEQLEQLRWIANGMKIKVVTTTNHTVGIDTPADLDSARQLMANITLKIR